MATKKVNYKFRIPWQELCDNCRELLRNRKKEQMRVAKREAMRIKYRNQKPAQVGAGFLNY